MNIMRTSHKPRVSFIGVWLVISTLLGILTLLFSGSPIYADEPNVTPRDTCVNAISAWQSAASIPLARIEPEVAVVNNRIYVISGFFDNTWTNTKRVDYYDIETNTWTRVKDIPKGVSHAGVATDGQYIWIAGGFQNWPVTKDVYRYDTIANQWVTAPSLPEFRGSGVLIRFGRNLHYFGGLKEDRITDMAEHWVLNLDEPLATATWTALAPMPANRKRNHMGAMIYDNKIYAFGGMFGHNGGLIQDVTLVDVYDPATDSWSTLPDMPYPRSHFEPGTSVSNNRAIVVGGRNNSLGTNYHLSNVTEFDPATGVWTELRPAPRTLLGAVGQVIGNTIFVTAGQQWGTTSWKATIQWVCGTPTPTRTASYTPSATATVTPTFTSTNNPTETATPTSTETASATQTETSTLIPPTETLTDIPEPTVTNTPTLTSTSTPLTVYTLTPSYTPLIPTESATSTAILPTHTLNPTNTPTFTLVPFKTATPLPTATNSSNIVNLIINGSFEEDTDLNNVPDHWLGKALTGDKRKCNQIIAFDGNCTLQFKGGLNEHSRFEQMTNTALVDVGDKLVLNAQIRTKLPAAGKIVIVSIKYADAAAGVNHNGLDKMVLKLTAPTLDGTYQQFAASLVLAAVPTSVKTQIRNKNLTGKIWVDSVSLLVNPPGEISDLIPLP